MNKTVACLALLCAVASAQTFDPAAYGTPGVVPDIGPNAGAPGAMHLYGRYIANHPEPILFELTGLPGGYLAIGAPSTELVAFVIDIGPASDAVTNVGGFDFYLPLNSPVINFVPYILAANGAATQSTIRYLGPADTTPVTSAGGSEAPNNRSGTRWVVPAGWYQPGFGTFSVQAVMLNTTTGATFSSNAVNFQ